MGLSLSSEPCVRQGQMRLLGPEASPALSRAPRGGRAEREQISPLDLAAPPLAPAGCGRGPWALLPGSPACPPTGGLSQLPSAVCRLQALGQTGT